MPSPSLLLIKNKMETPNQEMFKKKDYLCFVLKDKVKTDSMHLRVFNHLNLTNFQKTEKEIINKRRQMINEICEKNE